MRKAYMLLSLVILCAAASSAARITPAVSVKNGNVFNFNEPGPFKEAAPVLEPAPVREQKPVVEGSPVINTTAAPEAAPVLDKGPDNAVLPAQTPAAVQPATAAVTTAKPQTDANVTSGDIIEISADPAVNAVPAGTAQVTVVQPAAQKAAALKAAPKKTKAAVKKK